MEVRRRNVPTSNHVNDATSDLLRNLDVFPKLPDDCKKATSTGGAITLVTCLCSFVLVLHEIRNYLNPHYSYSYEVDKDVFGKLQINIDLTVATKCEYTSLDLLDLTGSSAQSDGKLNYEKTRFELVGKEREQFNKKCELTSVLRTHHHILPDLLWKRDHLLGSHGTHHQPVTRTKLNHDQYDACRVSGTLYVHKVAGNMHIVPGKATIGIGNAHIHLSPWVDQSALNFSHRIHHLSFGAPIASSVNPLDAVEKISTSSTDMFQYYLSIVPTRVVYTFYTSNTYQYAVTMKNRTINHSQGNHGFPGIFFTYDTFPLLVQIAESRELIGTFFARQAALVGGLFATVGLLRQVVCGIPDLLGRTRVGRRLQHTLARCNSLGNFGLAPMDVFPLNPDSDT